MASQIELGIDEYLRKRLMPVEGAIPHLARTDMYGNAIPAGSVGGDLFEYINFQQRYNIDARIIGDSQRTVTDGVSIIRMRLRPAGFLIFFGGS